MFPRSTLGPVRRRSITRNRPHYITIRLTKRRLNRLTVRRPLGPLRCCNSTRRWRAIVCRALSDVSSTEPLLASSPSQLLPLLVSYTCFIHTLFLVFMAACRPRTRWISEDDKILVQELLDCKANALQADSGWKSTTWTRCAQALANSELESGGSIKTADSCQTRWGKVRVFAHPRLRRAQIHGGILLFSSRATSLWSRR